MERKQTQEEKRKHDKKRYRTKIWNKQKNQPKNKSIQTETIHGTQNE